MHFQAAQRETLSLPLLQTFQFVESESFYSEDKKQIKSPLKVPHPLSLYLSHPAAKGTASI